MEPIISRVKPVVGFHIETINGDVLDKRVDYVKPSEVYVNLFKVRFEGETGWVDVIWLKRIDD